MKKYINYNNDYELILNKNTSLSDEVRKLETKVDSLATQIIELHNKIYKLRSK